MGFDSIKKIAQDSKKLAERIRRNEESQAFALEDWIFSDLMLKEFKSILELCSGTGKQSECIVKLSKKDARILLSDISAEACADLNKKFAGYDNVRIINKDIDDLISSSEEAFDMIFVSYGLYYSKYTEHILCAKIAERINPGGKFVIVGPTAGNNYELFGFLSSLGNAIPRPATYCCEEFMKNILNEMMPYSSEIKMKFVENKQRWNSYESLLTYWKSSTFYRAVDEGRVILGLKSFFQENRHFQITKKIAKFVFTLKG